MLVGRDQRIGLDREILPRRESSRPCRRPRAGTPVGHAQYPTRL